MVYPAHGRNGVIVLDDPVSLPEGTPVAVEVPSAVSDPIRLDQAPSLLDRLRSVVGTVHGLPPDAAANVDHYLYGRPRS